MSDSGRATNKGLGRAPEYEHDHHREPEDARTAPRAATLQTTHPPDNGHQPLSLDKRSSIWATEEKRVFGERSALTEMPAGRSRRRAMVDLAIGDRKHEHRRRD